MKPIRDQTSSSGFEDPDIFRTMFENANIGIFQTTLEGRYIRVNPALAVMYGYETADQMLSALTNISLQLYVEPGRRQHFQDALNDHGEIENFESQIHHRDGTIIWISETARVVRCPSNNAVYYEGFVKNITQRKRLEAEISAFTRDLESRVDQRTRELTLENERRRLAQKALKEALAKAEHAAQAKGQFLANMSHELRTPLNSIIGFSQAIQGQIHGPLQPSSYGEYVGIIESSAHHLLDLINDVLDLSKIDSGTVELNVEPLNVVDLMDDCIALIHHRFEETALELKREFDTVALVLHGDARRLKQVFLNLLSNAIKFTSQNGTITVSIASALDGMLAITIADTGIGISVADIPKVLSEYGQVEHGLDHVVEGTGLGLPISKKLVEMHGGQLSIASILGEGTTITVSLPTSAIA